MNKYKTGFSVAGEHSILDEEWLFSEEYSNNSKLVFLGYDANLMPMPPLREANHENFTADWFVKLKEKALNFTEGFQGEVWLDNVKIKEALEGEE